MKEDINKKCWRKLTFGMMFLALFAGASQACMILEEKNPNNSLWSGTIEYTVCLNFVFMGLALSFINFVDLYKLVRSDLSSLTNYKEKSDKNEVAKKIPRKQESNNLK